MFFRKKKNIPDGLWQRCDGCKSVVYKKKVEKKHNVCPECNHHFRVSTKERIDITLDKDSFEEYWNDMMPADPLKFVDRIKYKDRIANEQKKTKLNEAATVGKGFINGKEVVFGVTDSSFIMGSMGSVVGEKITRAAENGTGAEITAYHSLRFWRRCKNARRCLFSYANGKDMCLHSQTPGCRVAVYICAYGSDIRGCHGKLCLAGRHYNG